MRGDRLGGVGNGGEAREAVLEDEHAQRVHREHERIHAQVELEVVHQERLHARTVQALEHLRRLPTAVIAGPLARARCVHSVEWLASPRPPECLRLAATEPSTEPKVARSRAFCYVVLRVVLYSQSQT